MLSNAFHLEKEILNLKIWIHQSLNGYHVWLWNQVLEKVKAEMVPETTPPNTSENVTEQNNTTN